MVGRIRWETVGDPKKFVSGILVGSWVTGDSEEESMQVVWEEIISVDI